MRIVWCIGLHGTVGIICYFYQSATIKLTPVFMVAGWWVTVNFDLGDCFFANNLLIIVVFCILLKCKNVACVIFVEKLSFAIFFDFVQRSYMPVNFARLKGLNIIIII